jgi:uncharacterized protein
MRGPVVVTLLAMLMAVALTAPAAGQDVPSIYLYANDLVGVLTYDEVATLDEICYELDQYNSDELAIVIVNNTYPLGIDVYTFRLFEENGVGKEDKDNGVLLLVSTEERLWRVEVGYGLEGVLNDAKVGAIGRENLEPYLAVDDFYPGIFYTVGALIEELTAEPSDGGGGVQIFPGITIDWWHLGLAVVVFVAVAVVTKGRSIIWIGNVLTRGRFGGGSSGGGGAKGRF